MNVGKDNLFNREKWLEKTLAQIPPSSRILDAGAGEQQYKKFCNHLDYVSQDFGQYNGKGDSRGLQTDDWDQKGLNIISDITAIPEPNSSFDAIMCIEVFEHLPEPVNAIKEFSRLLKPNGFLILTAPFCSLTHMAPYHYYSGFSEYFYRKSLPDFGFSIIEFSINGNYYEYIAQEIRRIYQMSSDYSHLGGLSILDKLGFSMVIRTLQKLSDNNKNSEELLCFGYHVLAQKR